MANIIRQVVLYAFGNTTNTFMHFTCRSFLPLYALLNIRMESGTLCSFELFYLCIHPIRIWGWGDYSSSLVKCLKWLIISKLLWIQSMNPIVSREIKTWDVILTLLQLQSDQVMKPAISFIAYMYCYFWKSLHIVLHLSTIEPSHLKSIDRISIDESHLSLATG